MIPLNLRRTWSEIADYLSNNPNPLRIAELINRFPPCSWTFRFTFDGTGKTNVKVDCDHSVNEQDTLALLDGILEEVFFADAFHLQQSGEYLLGDTAAFLKDPPASNLITLQNSNQKEDSLLTLKGFWQSNYTPPEIQNRAAVRSYFLENTWLGSPYLADSEHYIRWIVFGSEQVICPSNRYQTKLGHTDIFTHQTSLYNTNSEYIGQAKFHTSPLLESNKIYTMFGTLAPQKKKGLMRHPKHLHWIVEIENEKLKQNIAKGKSNIKLVNELIDAVETARISVINSRPFQDYMSNIQRKRQTEAANRLRERQERVQTADRIIFNNKPVMLVPSNENEVLVLLSKLETLKALPFHEFTLWEYTARAGIDAIASYQIEDVDVPSQLMAVEVEHYFENFSDHEHSHHQVNMVICWDFRDGEAPIELHQRSEWLFEYRNDESFIVVVLSHIPNLKVRGPNNEQ